MSGNCVTCGIHRDRLVRDHIVPRWKFKIGIVLGNPNQKSNIQYICDNCHADKTRIDGTRERRAEAARKALALFTPEQRSENARKAALALAAQQTPEQRSENTRKGYAASITRQTPEEKEARRKAAVVSGRKGGLARMANMTTEEISALAKKANAAMPPNQRSEAAKRQHAAWRLLSPLEQLQKRIERAEYLLAKAQRDAERTSTS